MQVNSFLIFVAEECINILRVILSRSPDTCRAAQDAPGIHHRSGAEVVFELPEFALVIINVKKVEVAR